MSEFTDRPVRRRIALAVGAGVLAIVGGAGVAYAVTASDAPAERGWATVVDDENCPDPGGEGGSGEAAPEDGEV